MAQTDRSLVEALVAIEARLAHIERRLDRADATLGHATKLLGGATDALDAGAAELDARGERPEESVRALKDLLAELARPKNLDALRGLVSLAADAPKMVASVVDAIDDHAAELASQGIDLDARRKSLFAALGRLSSPPTVIALTRLLDSGLLDAGALEVVGALGRSLSDAAHSPSSEVGPFGLLAAVRERDVKAALGFAVNLARRFGAATRAMKVLPELPSQGERR